MENMARQIHGPEQTSHGSHTFLTTIIVFVVRPTCWQVAVMSAMEKDILDFTPRRLLLWSARTETTVTVFRPAFYGLDNVDRERPALYVGNHTIYGTLDTPLIYTTLYREKHRAARSGRQLSPRRVPVWRDILTQSGTVPGTRENCAPDGNSEHVLGYFRAVGVKSQNAKAKNTNSPGKPVPVCALWRSNIGAR